MAKSTNVGSQNSTAGKPTSAKGKAAQVDEDDGFLNEAAGEGTENIGAGDISTNYLKIAQSNSPELDEESGIPGLKAGHFFSSLNRKGFGKTIELIVVKYELVWNVWAPRESGGGLVRRVAVGGCSHLEANGKMFDDSGNSIAETQNFYVLVAGHEDLGIMTFSLASTMLKYGRKWNTMILQARTPNGKSQAAIFQNVWKLETIKNTNAQGTWYNIGDKTTAAIESVRTITKDEFQESVNDAFLAAKQIPSLTAGSNQAAIADHSSGNRALDEA